MDNVASQIYSNCFEFWQSAADFFGFCANPKFVGLLACRKNTYDQGQIEGVGPPQLYSFEKFLFYKKRLGVPLNFGLHPPGIRVGVRYVLTRDGQSEQSVWTINLIHWDRPAREGGWKVWKLGKQDAIPCLSSSPDIQNLSWNRSLGCRFWVHLCRLEKHERIHIAPFLR